MGTHGGKPLNGVEYLRVIAVLRLIDDGPFTAEILHPFLEEKSPGDIIRARFSMAVLSLDDMLPRSKMLIEYLVLNHVDLIHPQHPPAESSAQLVTQLTAAAGWFSF